MGGQRKIETQPCYTWVMYLVIKRGYSVALKVIISDMMKQRQVADMDLWFCLYNVRLVTISE